MIRAKSLPTLAALFVLVVLNSAVALAQEPVKQYTIEQFMNTVRIWGSSFSPDEKSILFSSNKSGIFNVYSVAATGGQPAQLTSSTKESTYAVAQRADRKPPLQKVFRPFRAPSLLRAIQGRRATLRFALAPGYHLAAPAALFVQLAVRLRRCLYNWPCASAEYCLRRVRVGSAEGTA